MRYIACMTKTLEQAFAELATLPEADQDEIGRRLLTHVEKLQALRADIDKGLRSVDAGRGEPLDIGEFLRGLNKAHGG